VQEEKMVIFIDFSHLMQFHFDAAQGFNFITAIVKEHQRFEPFLKKAVSQFVCDLGF
jgi:hypothetical protein